MRKLLIIFTLFNWVFTAQQVSAKDETIRIEALIDGRSQLHLRGNTAQWFHLDFAAPGRHANVIEPTVINGEEWFPVWPDQPDSENRNCDCYSDTFEGVVPGIPSAVSIFNLEPVQVRDKASIVQYPNSENEYTLIIEFDDNAIGGAEQYIVNLDLRPEFTINAGLNDAWYNPMTDGQGFFITVFPDLAKVSLAWFTYDTELPPMDATANLGDPGHRWMTALGPFADNQAVLNITQTSGGIFDTASEIERTEDGTIILTFEDCNSGTVEYDIPSIDQQGTVPIQRIAGGNVVLCQALAQEEYDDQPCDHCQ